MEFNSKFEKWWELGNATGNDVKELCRKAWFAGVGLGSAYEIDRLKTMLIEKGFLEE